MKKPINKTPRRANVEVLEPKLRLALIPEDTADTTPKRKPKVKPVPDNTDLWQRVAPGARWRDCVTHGPVECPDLSERTYKGGITHIQAGCPSCGCYLGNVKQRVESIQDPAALAQRYMEYRRQALAAGHKPGSAWYRFRHDFGRNPDPKWLNGDKGGAR
jgi:hypothetical protein